MDVTMVLNDVGVSKPESGRNYEVSASARMVNEKGKTVVTFFYGPGYSNHIIVSPAMSQVIDDLMNLVKKEVDKQLLGEDDD